MLKYTKPRHLTQLAATLLTNPHLANFRAGQIFKGKSKSFCAPGLNCYSCPAAAGACPIGSLQAVENSNKFNFSYYVIGFLLILGAFFGRFICGFLCPFGFFQDLLHKIPIRKIMLPAKLDKPLRYLKYLILAIFVIILPLSLVNKFGFSSPYFCKYICPAGTLEAGLPLLITNPSLRTMAGVLFNWKAALLVITIILSTMIYRPFCKYICPLGAIYAFFNRFSVLKMDVDKDTCINCMKCEKACDMQVAVLTNINGNECIRCGKCKSVCPTSAINWTVGEKIVLNGNLNDKPLNSYHQ